MADRQVSDHQRPLWLVEKLQRPGVPGGVSRHWGLSWPAGELGGTASLRPEIDAIGARSVARRSPDWRLESVLASRVQICGPELGNYIETLCHGRRRRSDRSRSAGERRPRSPWHGNSTYLHVLMGVDMSEKDSLAGEKFVWRGQMNNTPISESYYVTSLCFKRKPYRCISQAFLYQCF